MRFTFPALITASIKLCRRYKNREHVVGFHRLIPSFFPLFNAITGRQLEIKSRKHPQIHPPTHVNPFYPSRSPHNRPAIIPPSRTNRRRMRFRGPHLRSVRASLHRVRGQYIREPRTAAGDHPCYWDVAGCTGIWGG